MPHPHHAQPRPQPQRAPPPRRPGWLQALPPGEDWKVAYVVEVTSGDAVRIRYFQKKKDANGVDQYEVAMKENGKPDEKALIIDQIQAPKTARRYSQDEDAFGWEAKEFLRSKLISTPRIYIGFLEGPKVGGGPSEAERAQTAAGRAPLPPRFFSQIVLLDKTGDSSKNVDLAELMAKQGYAMVKELRRDRFMDRNKEPKPDAGGQANRALTETEVMNKTEEEIRGHYSLASHAQKDLRYKRLKACEDDAEANKRGKFSKAFDPDSIREVEWIQNRRDDREKAQKFYEKTRGRSVEAIVAEVREGTLVHLEIIPDAKSEDKKHRMVFVNIYGIKSPSIPIPYHVAEKNWSKDSGRPKPRPEDHRPERFALEAKQHTEERLLCQRVWVDLKNCDDRGNMYGDIVLMVNGQSRNIAPSLVKKGFAVVVNWQMPSKDLERAQVDARKTKAGVWSLSEADRLAIKSLPTPRVEGGEERGRVLAIMNGDCLRVEMEKDNRVRNVYLASIRSFHRNFGPTDTGPVMPIRMRDRDSVTKHVSASKEWLRKKAVGQQVVIEHEYDRTLEANPKNNMPKQIRQYFSVFLINKSGQKLTNLSRDLVAEGLAQAMSYDRSNNNRSKYYQHLEQAYQQAKDNTTGFHNPDFKESQILDLSITVGPNADNCKQQRNTLWRTMHLDKKGPIPADVEFVFGGHKIKVIVDVSKIRADKTTSSFRKNIEQYPRRAVPLFLEGIECTRATKNRKQTSWTEADRLNEEVATWAKEFVEGMISQREVKVKFTKMDKNGNYLGSIHVPQRTMDRSVVWKEIGQDGKPQRQSYLMEGEDKGKDISLGEMLLRRGLAKCRQNFGRGAESKTLQDLREAEEVAKNKRVGYWRFTETKSKEAEATNGQKEQAVEIIPESGKVKVTHVTNGAELYAVRVDARNDAWNQEITESLKSYPPKDSKKPAAFDPEQKIFSKNMVVAGCFMGGYYRCKIAQTVSTLGKPDKYKVHFLDYGNDADLDYADIEYLPENVKPTRIPPLARTYRLAFLKAPNQDQQTEIYLQAGVMLSDKTLEQDFTVTMLDSPIPNDQTQNIILGDGKDSVSINELMVTQGLCRVERGVIQRYRPGGRGAGGSRRRGGGWPGPKEAEYLDKVLEKLRRAKQKRAGIYHYGDVDSDNDDDN